MPYRGDVFTKGAYYHVYNRGVDRGLLFFNPENYRYCLRLVEHYARQSDIGVVAYCLMPNHYHFLLQQRTEEPLSKFVNVLFNAYVQAVNRQQERRGPLFEGRFRHVWIDRDEYLVHLCRYIHLNPVAANLVSQPEDWPHSDYREWVTSNLPQVSNLREVMGNIAEPEAYRRFVSDYQDEARARGKIQKYIFD